MTQMARAIKVYQETKADNRVEIELNDQPLLRFNDLANLVKFSDGTVWAFGDKGRPLVILAIERYSSSWGHQLISHFES